MGLGDKREVDLGDTCEMARRHIGEMGLGDTFEARVMTTGAMFAPRATLSGELWSPLRGHCLHASCGVRSACIKK